MPAYKIYYSPSLIKKWRLIPKQIRDKAELKEVIFKQNPQDPRLKTHPLTGKLRGNYSFSIDYHYRILFYYTQAGDIIFVDIGTHHIYR